MINDKLKNNWLDIINFNSKLNIIEDPKKAKHIVRIPLTPIKIDAYLFNYLLEYFYSEFVNDQQNILDLILSDFDIDNKVLGLYLSKTQKAGVIENIKYLPKDFVVIKEKDISDIDNLFNKIQSKILEEYKLKISSIRVIKRRGIDLINRLCEHIEILSFHKFLKQFIELIEKLIREDLFFIYPEPLLTKFIKNNLKILDDIKILKIFEILEEITPEFDNTVIINLKEMLVSFQIKKSRSQSEISKLVFNINRLEEFEPPLDENDIDKLIESIKLKTNSKNVLYLEQSSVFSLLKDFFYLTIPLKKEELKLFLQKVLFGYRSFNSHWKMFPKPKIYSTLLRFLIRLFGININFRKLSHWAIPNLIFNLIDTYCGLNSNLLFILTDNKNSNENLGLLLQIESSSIIKVLPININKKMSLVDLKVQISKEFGFVSGIIKLDMVLLREFLNIFIFNFHKFNFLSLIKIFKAIKNTKYFQIYPELPPYKILKKKSSIGLLKIILPIFIDKYEF
ncbi:MAG: hypothetical protein ACFE85_16470 [Candidatus Hodarchaeota archaeon]